MSAFTCLHCGAKFASADLQRDHYKTDWHRYNLKRLVAQLPPVTAEEFQKRVLDLRNAKAEAEEERQTNLYCNACRKQFTNQNAHDNHLNSKKHKEALERYQKENLTDETNVTVRTAITQRPHPAIAKALEQKVKYDTGDVQMDDEDDDEYEDVEEEEIDDEEWDEIPECPITINDCLFCTHTSENVVENLKHMSVTHSFFIPDTEFCIDMEGLLQYLAEKVGNFFVCLWCNDKGKTFYSLDAVRKHMVDKGHCQMLHEGIALAEYADYYDYSSSYPDHEEGMDIDEEVVPDLLDGDEYQLVLPSGAVIGHRSLLRYYKQRLNPNRALVPKKSDRKLHKVLSEYRALGWSSTQQQAAARKARDIHLMKRVQAKWQMKLGCRANKLQKHYRPQVLF
ncbi:zinc finger protein 622-like [Teleopsis dalmanni]|uniref:zinc finger protein 622-like n=1 Tax=Teleopsis dalmanni TaxID=139649 RepID=UPI0018CFD7A3|nr:zinc finger protein 622-like [Teleopsis dalmanni]XP_037936006.1 zinc finger protein 622-like [Teleopsis dalmanni]